MGCVFCDIVSGQIPAEIIYEDADILAFNDIEAKAPTHFLIIPKKHIESLNSLSVEDADIIAKIFTKIPLICGQLKIKDYGYRVVNNCGEDGGQTVPHIHFHVLGGRKFGWPPG